MHGCRVCGHDGVVTSVRVSGMKVGVCRMRGGDKAREVKMRSGKKGREVQMSVARNRVASLSNGNKWTESGLIAGKPYLIGKNWVLKFPPAEF